ncbi:TIGR04561 family membrane protein [Spiroplasma endosymbiont of Anurida maritima]|uniref:TIGR04561 family membrane protein n=1 Tax=Spiroplasma endosymbiont of Anurida maritima TaxID=2967972 RepID=UPI0036D423F9
MFNIEILDLNIPLIFILGIFLAVAIVLLLLYFLLTFSFIKINKNKVSIIKQARSIKDKNEFNELIMEIEKEIELVRSSNK